MIRFHDSFVKTQAQKERIELIKSYRKTFKDRADQNDKEGVFPFQTFKELKENGFLALTIPQKYGGDEISLYEFIQVQEAIAEGDGAAALCLGWHLGILMNLKEQQKWNEDTFQKVCLDIVENKKLINSAQTEPATGSPTRGGKPQTKASKVGRHWLLNGKKTYTSLAPALDYFIVSASIDGTDEVADFLVTRDQGIKIEENWDTLGMRSTRSDDLILTNVVVPEEALVEYKSSNGKAKAQGWLLHIPACYLGIAMSARNEAVQFARDYQPNTLDTPIKEVPEIRRKVGLMELQLLKARQLMYGVADRWDQEEQNRDKMGAELAAVKYVATNVAVEVVDLAMRIVGGQSLFRSNRLQRLYRDVRAGIHNPPADDITLSALAKRAFGD